MKNLAAHRPVWHTSSENNAAYYPIIFGTEELLVNCKEKLQAREIGTRRYFYPSLANTLPYLEPKNFEVTDSIAKRVLCLPLYFDLTLEEVEMICRLLLRVQNN